MPSPPPPIVPPNPVALGVCTSTPAVRRTARTTSMMTRAFLTCAIDELPDSTDRRLSDCDHGIGQVALHDRSGPRGDLVRAGRRQRFHLDDITQHGDADELAGGQRRSQLRPVQLDRGRETTEHLPADELT